MKLSNHFGLLVSEFFTDPTLKLLNALNLNQMKLFLSTTCHATNREHNQFLLCEMAGMGRVVSRLYYRHKNCPF